MAVEDMLINRHSHNTTLQVNYQAMLHCAVSDTGAITVFPMAHEIYGYQAIRQTVRIVDMDHPQGLLRTGDRATVTFEFISHPEFIK